MGVIVDILQQKPNKSHWRFEKGPCGDPLVLMGKNFAMKRSFRLHAEKTWKIPKRAVPGIRSHDASRLKGTHPYLAFIVWKN